MQFVGLCPFYSRKIILFNMWLNGSRELSNSGYNSPYSILLPKGDLSTIKDAKGMVSTLSAGFPLCSKGAIDVPESERSQFRRIAF
jgi:hypothetical protein